MPVAESLIASAMGMGYIAKYSMSASNHFGSHHLGAAAKLTKSVRELHYHKHSRISRALARRRALRWERRATYLNAQARRVRVRGKVKRLRFVRIRRFLRRVYRARQRFAVRTLIKLRRRIRKVRLQMFQRRIRFFKKMARIARRERLAFIKRNRRLTQLRRGAIAATFRGRYYRQLLKRSSFGRRRQSGRFQKRHGAKLRFVKAVKKAVRKAALKKHAGKK